MPVPAARSYDPPSGAVPAGPTSDLSRTSRATVLTTGSIIVFFAKITVPTLIIAARADSSVIGLNAIRTSYDVSAAKDKAIVFVKGASHGFPAVEPAAGGKDTQAEATHIIVEW